MKSLPRVHTQLISWHSLHHNPPVQKSPPLPENHHQGYPVFGKLFEKLFFDSMYNHFCSNGLLTVHQSGFRPGDSTINQLLSISHKIYAGFEESPSRETRAVFLDFSKAFDKVWHEGLLYKLECNGISGNLLNLIRNFLSNRKQRV